MLYHGYGQDAKKPGNALGTTSDEENQNTKEPLRGPQVKSTGSVRSTRQIVFFFVSSPKQ